MVGHLPTLRQLTFLSALAEHGSFSRAAEAAHVTQPTLSAGIKELETILGATLVERGARGAVLTPAGEAAVARARIVLTEAEDLVHVARAAGYRNFQQLRSQNPPGPEIDRKRIERAARYFDERGRWQSWPTKRGVRELCLWVIWARLPARQSWSEREISALIDEETLFRDAAQVRRSLVEMQLLTRDRDGSNYARVEVAMDPHGLALMSDLAERRKPQENPDIA